MRCSVALQIKSNRIPGSDSLPSPTAPGIRHRIGRLQFHTGTCPVVKNDQAALLSGTPCSSNQRLLSAIRTKLILPHGLVLHRTCPPAVRIADHAVKEAGNLPCRWRTAAGAERGGGATPLPNKSPFKERRIGIRRCPWEADEPCVRSSHRHLMDWGGFLIRPSMPLAATAGTQKVCAI
jgi:hypothetical protein